MPSPAPRRGGVTAMTKRLVERAAIQPGVWPTCVFPTHERDMRGPEELAAPLEAVGNAVAVLVVVVAVGDAVMVAIAQAARWRVGYRHRDRHVAGLGHHRRGLIVGRLGVVGRLGIV